MRAEVRLCFAELLAAGGRYFAEMKFAVAEVLQKHTAPVAAMLDMNHRWEVGGSYTVLVAVEGTAGLLIC